MFCALTLHGTLMAAMTAYQFSYSAPGGAIVDGELEADGIDADGFLTGISNVHMSVGATFITERSPMLNVLGISDFSYSPTARIRADGSLTNIEFIFQAEEWNGHPTYFVMQHLYETNPPRFEAEVVWDSHQMEYVGPNVSWSLQPVPEPATGIVVMLSASVFLARRQRFANSGRNI
jgi:hypothetical protein